MIPVGTIGKCNLLRRLKTRKPLLRGHHPLHRRGGGGVLVLEFLADGPWDPNLPVAGNLLPHLLAETPVSHSEHVIVPCRCWHTYSVKGRVVNIFSIRGHPVSVTTTFSCCCPLKAAQMTHRHTSFCGTSLCCAPRLIGCVFFFPLTN